MSDEVIVLLAFFALIAFIWWVAMRHQYSTPEPEEDEHIKSLGLPHTRRKGVKRESVAKGVRK